jgi:uncharacterized protein YggE
VTARPCYEKSARPDQEGISLPRRHNPASIAFIDQHDHFVKEVEMIRSQVKYRALAGILTLTLIAFLSMSMGQRAFARSADGAVTKQATSTTHTISVSGHGHALATPDEATLTVGVQTKGVDAQQALSSNSTKLNAVVAAIEAQGVTADHIKTSDLNLYLDSQSNTYQASHDLTVTLDNVAKVGTVLDAAVGAGANNSWGVEFGLKDASVQESQALTAAITDARRRADAMAAALGVSVTGVGSASDAAYSPPIQIVGAARAASATSAATQVQPGQLTTSADVNVVYTFG